VLVKRILATGACGQIGSELTLALPDKKNKTPDLCCSH